MDNKNLETKLKAEGKSFAPNVLDKVYKKVGLEFSLSKEEKVVEDKLLAEGKDFVKNDYKVIAKEVEEKKVNKHAFLHFLKNPATISISASLIVSVTATAIIVPTLLSKRNANNEGELQSPGTTLQLVDDNNVSLALSSGSQTYNAKIKFVVDSNDVVDTDSIVSYDDNSAYILDNFGNTTNIDKDISRFDFGNTSQDISTFTNKYLLTALNYGYLERNNINQANTITFTIDSSFDGGAYYSKVKETLEKDVLEFSKQYKVVINYSIEESKSVDTENLSEEDAAKVNEIIHIYELSTRLFVGSKRTLTQAYFSEDVNDWIKRFIIKDEQTLQAYIDMLEFFDENIKTQEDIDKLIDEFYFFADEYISNIDAFNSFLPIFDSRIKMIKAHLKVNGSDEVKEALNGGFAALVKYLNDKFARNPQDRINVDKEPSTEVRGWDYFEEIYNVYEEHHPHGGHREMGMRPGVGDIYGFLNYLKKTYTETTEYEKSEYALFATYSDLINCIYCRDDSIMRTDTEFYTTIFFHLEQSDDYFSSGWDDDFDHYQDECEGWDDDFDDWWNHHHGGPHH